MTTIEIKPADQVWGQGTRATHEALSRKEGTDFCVATIGPAGENLLPYAASSIPATIPPALEPPPSWARRN